MNLFDQYGIKEVADVTLYSIHKKKDGSGDLYYVPALYLDTLKVSTTEKTAESTWAEGGLGNARLINWDHSKTINVSLEDALCTPASLGMCWNGILSADWKDAQINYQTDICTCKNPVTKISRMEKAQYPRADRDKGIISNLLPHIKADAIDDYFGLLKISSVVDGTDVRGFGMVKNHTYRWKMAIESAVKSIAVVPDRFFDIKGKSYPIDWDRKVSINSLPTYENYKDAIIYKINGKSKCQIPPIAKIIYDSAMSTRGEIVDLTTSSQDVTDTTKVSGGAISLAQYLSLCGYTLYDGGYISKDDVYYIPFEDLTTSIAGTHTAADPEAEPPVVEKYTFTHSLKAFKIQTNEVDAMLPATKIVVNPDYFGDSIVSYLQNHAANDLINSTEAEHFGSVNVSNATCEIKDGDYLAIIVDNNNNYIPLIGQMVDTVVTTSATDSEEDQLAAKTVIWYKPAIDVDVTQFKGIDMWLRFDSINAMIYFLITKYEQDIVSINAATIKALNEDTGSAWDVNKNKTTVTENEGEEADKAQGKLWAYINPRTMQPYEDDYWFHQGEPYYVKSLTLAPAGKTIKGNRIIVKADQWPGMYMVVGETYIRNRDTGEDERMQIKFPSCKVKSDHTLTLEAGGDPVTFNLDLEVANPKSGHMVEITTYEVGTKMIEGENGCYYAVDGSSEVLSE